jgi:hypothetical protein
MAHEKLINCGWNISSIDKSEYKSVIGAAIIPVTRRAQPFAAFEYILRREYLWTMFRDTQIVKQVSCPVQTKKSTGHATEHISYPALSFNL